MEVRNINDKKIWESFVLSCEDKNFLHSWNWGEFNLAMGDKIWRLGIFENDDLLAAVLIIKIAAKRGSFLFCPQGPVFGNFFSEHARSPSALARSKNFFALPDLPETMPAQKFMVPKKNFLAENKKEVFDTFIKKIKEIAKRENVSFIRISPILKDNEENREIFKNWGFRDAPIHMHAETTWTLDITPSEQDLLANMRKTTRYSIKKAEKDGVEILRGNDSEYLKNFNELYQRTAKRHKFVPFSYDYLKNQLRAFSGDNQILVFLAQYKEKIISGAIIVYYGDSGFYHHGASSNDYPQITASYLLQWEAIKEAKKRVLNLYNFWGIIPKETRNQNHPWAGLTLFKMGFGGFQTDYAHAQDLPLKKSYWITYLIERMRRARRHL